MATPRDIRRLALRALVQLDAQGEGASDVIRQTLTSLNEDDPDNLAADDSAHFRESDVTKAFDLALAAFRDRRAADEAATELAPTWPAHRQPAVDRAIIRLAHHEITSGTGAPKASVNEAVELAKRYSTEKSPAFVNAVLDKILKRALVGTPGVSPEPPPSNPDA